MKTLATEKRFIKEKGINITEKKLKDILLRCEKCARVDDKLVKSLKFVKTSRSGEFLTIDIIDIYKKYKIVLAIYYFTRKLLGFCLISKNSSKIVNFLCKIRSELKLERLFTDNGKDWCYLNKVDFKQQFRIIINIISE